MTLANPVSVADADGGFVDTYTPLDPPDAFAAIVPVTARDQERAFAGTVLATATHEITVPYHPGVTIETRVTYIDLRSGTDARVPGRGAA